MKNRTQRYFSRAAAAAAIMAGATLTACAAPHAADASIDSADPVAVVAVPAAMNDVSTTIAAGGVVQARTTAVVTSRLLAPVREVRVVPGDRVRKGQPLVVLDSDDLAAAARAARSGTVSAEQAANAAAADLEAAQAALVLARTSHDRVAGLLARHSATAQELDEATAALQGAEARVAGASARVVQATAAVDGARATSERATVTASFATILAPFDGIVTEKMVEPGNMAAPGTPLLRVEDTGGFRLEVRVDESRAAAIRTGDSVPVLLGDGRSVTGTVVEMSRAVDADARAFLVKIGVPGVEGLQSGEFGKARFHGTARRGLTVPSSSIVRRGQLASVFVVEHDTARVRLVDVRESEVVAGLVEGELVIVSPPPGLTDGRRVRVGGR